MFTLHDMRVLTEPAYDASKWTIVQPTDDPAWLEKSMAETAWDSAYTYIHFSKSLEVSHPQVATLLGNVAYSTQTVSDFVSEMVVEERPAADVAAAWVAANEDAVIKWLTE